MKLLTLNCHSWQEENQLEKIKYLAKVISEKKYDVVALQEISQSTKSKIIEKNIREDNFAVLLKEELNKLCNQNYEFYWDFSHIGYDIYEEGLAIMSRHKFVDSKSFFVTKGQDRTYWKTRKIVKSSIAISDKVIDFYSCHLGWWNDEDEPFKYQADELISSIDNDRITILMGDFNNNAFIRNEGYDYLINNNLTDLYLLGNNDDKLCITAKGKIDGWEKNKENLRLDFILSNKSLNVRKADVIFNGNNKEIISDHYGIEMELEI